MEHQRSDSRRVMLGAQSLGLGNYNVAVILIIVGQFIKNDLGRMEERSFPFFLFAEV